MTLQKFILPLLLIMLVPFTWAQETAVVPAPEASTSSEVASKPFPKVWIRTEIVPVNFAWKDLGLSKEASFTGPINAAWKKWVAENLPATVGETDICSGECLNFVRNWESLHQLQSIASPDSLYGGGVWLLTSVNIWRHQDHEGLRFNWEGRAVLIDINTKRVMSSLVLGPYSRQFPGLEGSGLNSALGNQIYRSPLPLFKNLLGVLEKGVRLDKALEVKVTGQKNLQDVLELMKLIQTRGSHLALEMSMIGFTRNEAHFLCFYRGEEKSFTDLLSQLKELKSSHSYNLVSGMEGKGAVIQMVAR